MTDPSPLSPAEREALLQHARTARAQELSALLRVARAALRKALARLARRS